MQPNSQAVPYCQKAPNNSELNGLFQCQYQGADQQTFVGDLALGSVGTIPFGLSTPLSPLGSCAANPTGPVVDGSQLIDVTWYHRLNLEDISHQDESTSATTSPPATVAASTRHSATSEASHIASSALTGSIEHVFDQYFSLVHYVLSHGTALILFVFHVIYIVKRGFAELIRPTEATRRVDGNDNMGATQSSMVQDNSAGVSRSDCA